MRIALAGRAALQSEDGNTVPVTLGAQAQLVLAYLTLERHRPVSRDELADLLWADELPTSWKQLIRGVIAQIRSSMRAAGLASTELLTTAFGSYQLNLPDGAEVDLEVAAADLALARDLLADGDPNLARHAAERASVVVRRRFLPLASGEWVEAMQTHLREQHLRALDLVAGAALADGDALDAVDAAEAAIRLEPYRESAFALLMEAHLALGARTSALDAYERCRRQLAADLGVEPSPTTEAIRARVVAAEPQEIDLDSVPPMGPSRRVATRPRRSAPSLEARRRGPFAGRAAELEEARRFLDDPARSGTCRMVVIEGEAGAGKTRLAAELAAPWAEGGRPVLHGWCAPAGPTFAPFRQLLPALIDLAPAPPTPEVLHALGPLRSAGSDGASVVTDPDARSALLEAWVTLVADAADQGLALVIDDLQWATASALALLGHLLLTAPGADVAIVATSRDDPASLAGPVAALLADVSRTSLVHRHHLRGLDRDAVAELFSEVLGGADGPIGVDELHQATDGNALFVTETIRHWAAGGTGMPPELTQAVLSQVDRLPTDVGELLTAAAVVGTTFDLSSAALLAGVSEEEALSAFEVAAMVGLVLEVGERWSFSHALVGDVLAGQLTAARRARLHSRLGHALAERPGAEPSEVAAHLLAGVADDRPLAGRFLADAGRRAMVQLAFDAAATYFRRAIELADGGDAELLLSLSQALSAAGQRAEARSALLDAAEVARRHPDPELLATVAVAAATRRMPKSTGRSSPTNTALLEEAADRLPPDNRRLKATVLSLLAMEYRFTVHRERAEPLLNEARRLVANLDDPAVDLLITAAEESESIDPRVNLRAARRWLAAAVRNGQVDHRLWATVHLVWSATGAGRLEEAARAAEDLERAARLSGHRSQLWWPTAWEASRAIVSGDFAAAAGLIDEVMLASTGPEAQTAAVQSWFLRIALERLQGRIDGELVETMTAFRAGLDDERRTTVLALWTRWHAGDRTAIAEVVGTDPTSLLSVVPDGNSLCQAGMLGELAAAAPLPASARHAIAAWLDPYAGCWLVFGFAAGIFGSVDRTLGLLAAADHDVDRARSHLTAAADAFDAQGARAWSSVCRSDLAELEAGHR